MTFLTFVVSVSRNTYELLCHIAANKLLEGVFVDVAELPFVKHVEVAGEDASVALDYRVAGANTSHSAVFGRSAEKHTDIVVKVADTYRMTRAEILVVLVKGDLQELGISFGCQREDLFLTVEGIKARNKLNESVFLERIVDLFRRARDEVVHHAEDVEFYAEFVEKPRGFLNSREGTLSHRVYAERIVDILSSVHRKTDEKFVIREEFCPFLVDDVAVGLNGILNGDFFYVILLFKLKQLAVKVEPRKGRLPALKGEGSRAACVFKCFFDKIFKRRLRHNTVGFYLSVIGYVGIEAVFAPHIAKRRRGLDKNAYGWQDYSSPSTDSAVFS